MIMFVKQNQGKQGRKMLGHIAGCIPFANLKDFALTLFRATRGNMLLKHEEIGSILDPAKVIRIPECNVLTLN